MKTIAHPTLAMAVSVLCGLVSFSIRVFFAAAYDSAPLPIPTELSIHYGGVLYLAVFPALIVTVTILSRKYNKEDTGDILCHIVAIFGLALLALGIHAAIAKTTFGLSGG